MKNLLLQLLLVAVLINLLISQATAQILPEGFVIGTPDIQSMHALSFGPDGILFIGDSKSAAVFAIDTKDASISKAEDVDVKNVDVLIASALGSDVTNIVIQDMAINPLSKRIYLAVHNVDGSPVLLTLDHGQLAHFVLADVSFSKKEIPDAIDPNTKDQRGRPLRQWAISDLDYFEGKVLVSGLSNKEFSSALSMFPFPFDESHEMTTLEIWHAAHGKYETHSPIKTFTTMNLDGEPHVVASYTCTPLVLFPLKMLKSGQHIKGKTVAELGNRNTPLDIITVEKDGKPFILMANTSRALMKISHEDLSSFKNYLTEPVKGNSETAGVDFLSLPLVNVLQLDKLDENRFVMLQRKSDGNLDLHTGEGARWL